MKIYLYLILITEIVLTGCSSHTNGPAPVTDLGAGKSRTDTAGTYRVAAGDTLYSISWRYGLRVDDLIKINRLNDGSKIRVGQVLQLAESVVTRNRPISASGDATAPPAFRVDERISPASGDNAGSIVCCLKNKSSKPSSAQKTDQSIKNMGWLWPVKGKVVTHFMVKSSLNKGIDIQSKLGEPVLAASDGEVVYAGSGLRDYGKLVILKHADKYLSAYGNNNLLLVQEGEKVRAGQKIAEVGNGYQGDLLHFEIRYDGQPVDPLRQLPPL